MINSKLSKSRTDSDKIFDENVFMASFMKQFLKLLFSKGLQVSVTSDKDVKPLTKYIQKFMASPSVGGSESINEFCRRIVNAAIRHGDVLVYLTSREDALTEKDDIKLNIVSAKSILTPPDDKKIRHGKDGSFFDATGKVIREGYVFEKGVLKGYTIKAEIGEDYIYFPRTFNGLFSATTIKSPIDSSSPFETRPKPSITPAITTLLDVTKLIKSEVKAQTLKAKIPAVLEILDSIDDETMERAKDNLMLLMQEVSTNDANIIVAEKGTQFKALDLGNSKESNIRLFIEPLLRYVSSIFGVSYEALTNDISNASGSTARATYAQAFADTEIWRQYLYNELLNPVVFLICDFIGVNPDDYEWQFSVKPFGYIRAKEEIDANNLAMTTGQKTRYEVITEQGYNPEEMFKQDSMLLALERKYNPLAGVDMEMLQNVLVNFNDGKYSYKQSKVMLESFGLNATDYLGEEKMEIEEKEKEVETKVEETKVEPEIELVEAKNEKLDKAYTLFAEFHGVLDEQYTPEQKQKKYKELVNELGSAIGFKDTELEETKTKLSSYEQNYKALEEKNKVLEKLASEFKKAKFAADFGDKSIETGKSEQEIYDSLSPIEQSRYLNSLRKARGN